VLKPGGLIRLEKHESFAEKIKSVLRNSIDVKMKILESGEILASIEQAAKIMIDAFKSGKKVLICGNGGSAADAQHIAAELTGKFYKDREPLYAEALHVNTSYLTAVANDYSFDEVFSRQVKSKGRTDDILIAISTSGSSENIIRAAKAAREIGMKVIGLTGETGGALKSYCNICICVPSKDTPRIQEAHITIGHIICEIVEAELFGK
jgi:D-sedoheptulose 7-phosphate isomerase